MPTTAELESAWRAGGGHLGHPTWVSLRAAYGTAVGFPLQGYAGGGASYASESSAIFNAFTTPPTTARKNLIDAAVVALKAAGVWAKLDTLYLFAAADRQAAIINWKAPGTYNCTEVGAPTFTADRGFLGAASKYLDTSFIPSSAPSPKFTLNDASAFAWSLTAAGTAGGTGIIGPSSGVAMRIYPRSTDLFYGRLNGAETTIASTDGSGLFCVSRANSSNHVQYKNGAVVNSPAAVSSAVDTASLLFMAGNIAIECAGGGFGSNLTAADNTALYNALAAYMAGLATDRIAAAFTTPPSAARKTLIQTCVTSLMQGGVWDKLDTLYLFAAADRQAAIVNWINPGTYNCSEVSAPTFTVDQGFTGASGKYLDSGFNPTTAPSPKFVQNDATLFAWSATSSAVTGGIVGTSATGGAGESFIIPFFSGNQVLTQITASAGINAGNPGSGAGLTSVSRTDASTTLSYKNGTALGGITASASTGLLNSTIRFLQRGTQYYDAVVCAGGVGSQLSAADNTALYNALRTYLTGVGVP